MSVEIRVKRGEKSFGWFVIAFTSLLAFGLAIITTLSLGKITVAIILLYTILIFWLCFLSDWFRNKIVGWFSKLENRIERH